MNYKTTLLLFVLVVIVVGAIFVFQNNAPPTTPTLPPEPTPPTQSAEKPLVEDFGDAVSITVQHGNDAPWRFERDRNSGSPSAGWNMVEPYACGVADWQVAQIASRIKGLKYTVKYDKPGDGMTAEQAGLDAPRAAVTVVDDKDKKIEVQVGRNEGETDSYVRLAGSDAIYRVKPSLKTLLKDKAIDYREQQLFTIPPNSVVQIAITERADDGTMSEYELVKNGADWRFTKPAPAKAVAEKIRTLESGIRSLRALAWVDGAAQDMQVYGLDPAPLTVTVTTEEVAETPADTTTDGEAPPPPPPVMNTYTVHFSTATPLGEDNKVYLRAGDENAVATVMKTTVDKFRPDLKEWRDNRLLERDPAQAERITLTTDGKTTTYQRTGADWAFADSNAPADGTEFRKLLGALKDTQALNFESGISADPERFGFDAPRGVVEIAYGDGTTRKLVFGAYADPKTQRLVFAHVDDGDTAMKLHNRDVSLILRSPEAFRDRTVAAMAEKKLRSVTVTSPVEDKPMTVKLDKDGDAWSMVEPVASAVNDSAVRALVALLGNFHATNLIDRGDNSLGDYGLDDPQVRLVYTYQPDPILHVSSNGVTPVESEPQSLEIDLARKDGKLYALRAENDGVVYEVPATVWQTLTAEFRKTDLFSFDAEQVSKVSFRDGDDTQGFEQDNGKWLYVPEADIPVDATAVKNYVLRVHDLKVQRVIEYNASDLAAYELDAPQYELTVDVDGQTLPALLISSKTDPSGAHYAKSAGAPHVFLLPKDVLDRVRISLNEFEQKG
ncbi:MAG: DUF4340 domain-containing protein [Phycisphaerales bacterium]|nr:DUF4340 domain-containing protein [Phycisphaerales bacterium]